MVLLACMIRYQIDKYIQKLIQELINFESPKATITQRPHMKQPQTSLKEKPSWSLFRGVKVKLAWSKKLSTDFFKKTLLDEYYD